MRERKPIDAALRRFLDEQASIAGPPPTGDAERLQAARSSMTRALANRTSIQGLPNAVQMRKVEITPGLSANFYVPLQEETGSPKVLLPILIYLHGGGWAAGSTATHDPFCRLLSESAGVAIASVEYRLAPEHPYPEALEDTLSAVHWASHHAVEFGGNPARLILGGDSAGANLAAVAANRLCSNATSPVLSALLLLYPVIDHPSAGYLSYTENATGYGLDANTMRWFWQQYAADVSPDDPNISPQRLPNLPKLPPTLVATAEYDVLRDEGLAYLEKLSSAGVAVTHLHSPDMHHNFPVTPATVARFPQCVTTLDQIANWLRTVLNES